MKYECLSRNAFQWFEGQNTIIFRTIRNISKNVYNAGPLGFEE
jgi:hypothetical protein